MRSLVASKASVYGRVTALFAVPKLRLYQLALTHFTLHTSLTEVMSTSQGERTAESSSLSSHRNSYPEELQ
jgi:hypothetical protein